MTRVNFRIMSRPNWQRLAHQLDDTVAGLIRDAAHEVEAEAKRLAPVDTGRLRASIRSEQVDEMEWAVVTNVEYAPHLEFGTMRMNAQPFLRPAVDLVRDRIRGML